MAKLSRIEPRLTSATVRFAAPVGDEKARDKHRQAVLPWRQWYKSARWRELRHKVLLRDHYICQRTGVLCIAKWPEPFSPVVNHKKPHNGDPALFWDITNLETVSKKIHDSVIQSEERMGWVK